MTRSVAGLTVLLCVLFCAVPLRAPAHAATMPFFGVGPEHLPHFDTSYYLIFQPLPRAALTRASVRSQARASADSHALPRDTWRFLGLALPVTLPGSNPIPFLRDHPARVALMRPAQWPVWERHAQSGGKHPLVVTRRPIWFNAEPFPSGPAPPTNPDPDVTLGQNTPAPVPLPAGMWLLASGLGFALFFRRRSA